MEKILTILIVSIILIALIAFTAGLTVVKVVFKKTFASFKYDPYVAIARYDFYENELHRELVNFESGKNILQGYFYKGKNKDIVTNNKLIVFSHGIWSGHEDYMTLLKWFIDHGISVFAYDYTAYNNSKGYSAKGLPQSMLDLNCALDFIEKDKELSKYEICLLGHSWGAYASTAVLKFKHNISKVVAMSGFDSPLEISMSTASKLLGTQSALLKPFVKAENKRIFGKQANVKAIDSINSSEVPVLIIHGAGDKFIEYDKTALIAKKDEITNPNVSYYTINKEKIDNHNSYINNVEAATYIEEIVADFKELEKQYGKEGVPKDVKDKFFEDIDRNKSNQANVELCQRIYDFIIV